MKKVPLILCSTAAVMLLCMVLFFVCRNQGSGTVRISDYHSPAVTAASSETASAVEAVSYPIDINSADLAALMTLPGIGEVYAQRILAYRAEHGDFTSATDLLNISGIGTKRLEAILEYITIGGCDEDTGC